MDESNFIKNDINRKSKVIAGLLCIFFGVFGFHRIYMGKRDFLWAPILVIITGGMFGYFLFINAMIILCMSDKRFQMLCQVKKRKMERKILGAQEFELDKLATNWGMVLPDLNTDETLDTVADNYKDKHAMDSDTHEHIKADKNLSKEINRSQDRLERYKNNDYFPSVDVKPPVRNVQEKMKELREELKAGLISKEDYNEEISNLFKK